MGLTRGVAQHIQEGTVRLPSRNKTELTTLFSNEEETRIGTPLATNRKTQVACQHWCGKFCLVFVLQFQFRLLFSYLFALSRP